MAFDGKDMHIQGPQIDQFNNIAPRPVPRSSFRRDHTRRMTFEENYLIPIFVDEILPGDDVHLKLTAMTRVATPIKPIMDNLYQETMFFFIPNRLVWDNWEKFQGAQINPGDSTDYTIPVLDKTKAPMSTTGFLNQSVFDYLELPTLVTGLSGVSCLFNRAVDLCWNEWFRDENLQNSLTIQKGDGPDDPAIYALRKRGKRKDYITSALPWPQKGDAVIMPLGTSAPVISTGETITINTNGDIGPDDRFWYGLLDGTMEYGGAHFSGSTPFNFGAVTGLSANLEDAVGPTINALRQVAIYQQILELDARGGTRYVESIYSRFGVISPDFRLQRPELIGQGSTKINVFAVPQTAPTSGGGTPQGNLAAFGTGQIQGDHGCRYSATEHGMIIGFMNVRADLTYQYSLQRKFTRSTRLDFYEPLQNGLGEQVLRNDEVFATGTSTDSEPFGFQERFAEYRFKQSVICGKFRSNDPQSLDVWGLWQEFGALPSLNGSFIEENVPMDRVVAVPSEPSFISDIFFTYNHVRPLPIRSNPGIDIL